MGRAYSALLGAMEDKGSLKFTIEHRGVIARFGCFAYRGALLSRQSGAAEEEATAQAGKW